MPYHVHATQAPQLARRAGVPDGVINVVTTHKNVGEVGKEMCESKIVKKVSFTGSTPVAKLLAGMAASTLKKLGPSSPDRPVLTCRIQSLS